MQHIDVYKLIEDKNPRLARRVPGFLINYLRRVIHQDEINEVLGRYGELTGVEFVQATLNYFDISYHSVGMDRLDPQGRYVFASNHPFGGVDGLMLASEVNEKFGDVRVVVNDLLMNLGPLAGLFIPVNKHGRQNEAGVNAFNDAFASDIPVITFPAGLCSRKVKGEVCDLQWKSNFVRKSVQSGRDIVPVYFDGRLSNFFYRLAGARKFFRIRGNIEMLYLVDEMVKQRGSDFEIRIGEPIPNATLLEGRNVHQATEYIRSKVYEMQPARCK